MDEVILGMPGPWADDNFEAADHYTTKIGGVPDWPTASAVVGTDLLRCQSCGNILCLVAQIYAPISSKILTIEERIIYIFGCVAAHCGATTWRALRVQKALDDKESNTDARDPSISPLTSNVQDDLWTFESDEENDGKDDELDLELLGKALAEATSLASNTKKQNSRMHHEAIGDSSPIRLESRVVDDKTPVLPCFYTYTQEENFSKDVASFCSSYSSLTIKDNQSDGNGHASEEAWEGEDYEYDRALNADRNFLKFKKRMDLHPEQCFRYSYGGKPLLASVAVGDPGQCMLCGELRHYEVQLMPPLLFFLHEATKNSSLENWNWMSLVVYTCSMSCSPSSNNKNGGWVIAEESILVQTE